MNLSQGDPKWDSTLDEACGKSAKHSPSVSAMRSSSSIEAFYIAAQTQSRDSIMSLPFGATAVFIKTSFILGRFYALRIKGTPQKNLVKTLWEDTNHELLPLQIATGQAAIYIF